MKLSKPKLTKCRASKLWMCDGGYTTYASTPEKAYSDWLAKETEEPHHLYSKRSIRELIVRMEKHKKENPEMFEEKVYSGRPSAPEPLINITYLDPKDMEADEWCAVTQYSSGNVVKFNGETYNLTYLEGESIYSINQAPDVSCQWVLNSGLNTKYEITKTSLVETKPKRWWEFWK